MNGGRPVTNPSQPIAKATYDDKRYKGKYIVILEGVPWNHYKRMVSAEWLSGKIDSKKMDNVRKELVAGSIDDRHTVMYAVRDMLTIAKAVQTK